MDTITCESCGEECYVSENELGQILADDMTLTDPDTALDFAVRGNSICDNCLTQQDYVDIVDADAATVEAYDAELPGNIQARRPIGGEAEGFYRKNHDGTLQILGYSCKIPSDLDAIKQQAWERMAAK